MTHKEINNSEMEKKAKLLLADFETKFSASFFDGKPEVNIVIIPQIHLVPYVYSILLRNGFLFSHKTIVVHQAYYKMARDLFLQWPNILQLDIKFSINCEEIYFRELLKKIQSHGLKVNTFVLHNFAGGINGHVAESIQKSKLGENFKDVVFYADGSRNNSIPEIDSQVASGYQNALPGSHLEQFGFVHHTTTQSKENSTVISYDYLETSLKSFQKYSSFKKEESILREKSSLIVTRYWGRDPYFFDPKKQLIDIFIESISEIIKPETGQLVLRNDARFNIPLDVLLDRLKTSGFDSILFESLFSMDGALPSTLLFENFILDNPEILRKFDSIYCFDSSFPLIFQNKLFHNLLPESTKIYVGFNRKLIHKFGIKDCYQVMKRRTVETIISIISTKRFSIFSDSKLIFSPGLNHKPSIDELNSKFEKNSGYFLLVKC